MPGAAAEKRVADLLAAHGLARRGFVVIHPGSRWLFKCWPAQPTAALLDRAGRDGLAARDDGRARSGRSAARQCDQGGARGSDRRLERPTDADRAVGADRRRAPVHRLRHGADASRGRGRNAGRRLVRAERRERVGTVAGAAPCGHVDCASVPALPATTAVAAATIRIVCFTLPLDPGCRRRSASCSPKPARALRDEARDRAPALHAVRRRGALRRARHRHVDRARRARARVHARRGRRRGRGASSPSSATRTSSAASGATRASRGRCAQRSRATVPISCRRTSASPAATSSAPATASTARGSRSGCAPAACAERLAIAANPHHRYTLAAESRVFRGSVAQGRDLHLADGPRRHSPSLCVARRKAARDLQRRRFTRVQSRRARGARGHARAARLPETRTSSFVLVGSGYARKGVPGRAARARAAARPGRASSSSAATSTRRAMKALARRAGVRDRVVFAGPQQDPRPYLGRGRRVRPAHALRSAVERGAGGACLRPAGRDQPSLRRGRARRRARRRLDLRRRATLPRWRRTWSVCWTTASAARVAARAVGAVAALTPDAMAQRLLALYDALGASAIIAHRASADGRTDRRPRLGPASAISAPCAASPAISPTILGRAPRSAVDDRRARASRPGRGRLSSSTDRSVSAHRRLSVIDLAGSRQPLVSADGAVAVVFNGEIYNFRALRRELAAAGHVFVTQGDGEVLVHGWKAWGPRMLDRLAGMFAFALWDRGRRELFLARDHLGVKPLYYAWHDGALAFGSELKALRPFPGLPHAIDLDALALYLECQYIPAPRSIYRAIRKLPAGHWLSVRDGALATGEFWRPTYVPKHELRGSGRRRRARRAARAFGRIDAGRRRAARRIRERRRRLRRRRRARHAHLRPRARHIQPGLHRYGGRQRAHRGGARCAAHRQPASLPDARARRRAARARPLGRRVRRAVRRPGRAADDAARAIRAARGDRRADRRRRRRGLRRLFQLREAAARGAPDPRARRARLAVPVARPPPAAAPRARPDRQGRGRTALAPLRDHPEHLRLAVARRIFHAGVRRRRARADRRSCRGRSTTPAIRPITSIICSTSMPGCGSPTTCSRKSTGRRWRTRSKRACRISTTCSTAGARDFLPRSRCAATRASASSSRSPCVTCRATSSIAKSRAS